MARYYLDIETHSRSSRPNPVLDEIITIQFQQIDAYGEPVGGLQILKSWESSEEQIVKQFYARFMQNRKPWDFIPVGFNLNFEFDFFRFKFAKYLGTRMSESDFHGMPYIDLKHLAVLLNNGEFKGSSLDKFSSKPCNGSVIKEYYENRNYAAIEDYIAVEAKSFIDFYRRIIKNSEKWKKDVMPP
ncbi:hypothetical protein H0O02_05085 [Candidatus Micrarchaeota archaeon]|nr:hypothetical protein [Candidatus Micrarchaeota archaeon]